MQLNDRYDNVFGLIPIFGMIHLAGENPVKRALEELAIFEEEGVDAAIIENYHGSTRDVVNTLKAIQGRELNVVIGINILPNEFSQSIPLAHQYGADFVQLDHIAGTYERYDKLDFRSYEEVKNRYPNIIVLGGVWPKYYEPIKGSDLEKDLELGVQRAEAIVVTGEGTGCETPFDKIKRFREAIGNHPLVVGAGLTPDNAYEQLCIANGAIVGTCFKVDDDTHNNLDIVRIRDFMAVVKQAREYQELLK